MARPPTQYAWGADAMARSRERDEDRRAAQPVRPSSSSNPARCSHCGHWGATTRDQCAACGLPWEPQPVIGLERGA